MTHYLILLIMTVVGSFASFFLKRASKVDRIISMLQNLYLYIGGGLYFASAIMNIYILRYLEYSVVLPLTSLTYVWTMLLSGAYLKEQITKKKIIGIVLIVIGALLVSRN